MKGIEFVKRVSLAPLAALVLTLAAGSASAQDFATYKGDNARTGKNASPNTSGPGQAFLTWFHPTNAEGRVPQIDVDNNDVQSTITDPIPVETTGTWATPAIDEEASFPYLPTTTAPTGVTRNPNGPAYAYSTAIASSLNDPTVALNPADTLSTFTWRVTPPAGTAVNYALYVWLPIGPTIIGGTATFPQRYYVYEITYSSGFVWREIIDTYNAGEGWVRIGNGGLPTNQVFPSDGTNPITVKLYNTIPRDASGNLTDTPGHLVYADAILAVPQIGSYAATPIVGQFNGSLGLENRVVGCLNTVTVGTRVVNGATQVVTATKGQVSSYDYSTGTLRWTFSPAVESDLAYNLDNTSAAVTVSGTDFVADTTAASYRGANYFSAPIQPDPLLASTVTYDTFLSGTSQLEAANYDIYVWLPGDSNGQFFAHNLQYEVHEGATVTTYTLDQSLPRGWVRLGARQFTDNAATGDHLYVVATNYSADATDAGRTAYVDAIKFVGANNLAITATPLQTTALVRTTRGGAPVDKPVVIVAAENGKIYCLDAEGRGDGSTDILWTYPSTRDPDVPLPTGTDPDTWLDPNLNPPDATNTDWAEIDGAANQRVAEMPNGFGLSSPLLERIGGSDYLYVASSNGRVYCIDVAGRGDMDLNLRKPGTTSRVWTYPDDYPAVVKTSALGTFSGSLSFATTAAGPTLFVPAAQGRLYALDAVGDATTHVTTERWAYPLITDQNLGPITTTPSIEFGKVFFGTSTKDGNAPGQFLAVDQETGLLAWELTGTTAALDNFLGGPATASGVLLGDGINRVFATNENRYVYCMNADTGALLWETNELQTGCRAPLTYTVMDVFDNLGAGGFEVNAPVVVVPTSDGRLDALFVMHENAVGGGRRRAREYWTASTTLTAGVSVGYNFMYAGDNAGNLYAFSNVSGGFGSGDNPPGSEGVTENDPDYGTFKDAKIKLITRDAYVQLRQIPTAMTKTTALSAANALPPRTPLAFEWGETIYMLIYDYDASAFATPPTVNVNMSMDGQTVRNIFAETRTFAPEATGDTRQNYALVSFTIQGSGPNALPPGHGLISINFNAVPTAGGLPSNFPGEGNIDFYVANPLALVGPNGQAIGNSTVLGDPGTLENGNTGPALVSSMGDLNHGSSGSTVVGVVDRSLMTLVRGPGRGLDNVRVERRDLAWQGGVTATLPYKQLNASLFPLYEDLPANFPNTSLDYPDISRERVKVTKSILEVAENPVDFGVSLLSPQNSAGGDLQASDDSSTRLLRSTTFDLQADVPLFQPPNLTAGSDQLGNSVSAGYLGTYTVFVDSTGNGVFDRNGLSGVPTIGDSIGAGASPREAFRTFNLSGSVIPDERMSVQTPTVDLGSLATGTGYTPFPADTAITDPTVKVFNPWTGAYSEAFKTFDVVNEGNVNMLNLRVAKSSVDPSGSYSWQILAPSNEPLAYLSGDWNLWSDMDPWFAATYAMPGQPVILQKARVGDRSGTHLSVNPQRRENGNLGVAPGSVLDNTTFPPGPPKVGVSLPLGFPSGTYSQILRVIEDTTNANLALDLDADENPLEVYSEPSFTLKFTAREAQLTGGYTTYTAPFFDDAPGATPSFNFSRQQPGAMRDLSGNLLVAYTSDQPTFAAAPPGGPQTDPAWKLWLGYVKGVTPATLPTANPNPLADLNFFDPDPAGRWFRYSPSTAAGYPSAPGSLTFNIGAGESIVGGTLKYTSPVFPAQGQSDPFGGSPFTESLMAFLGTAQVQTGSGRVQQNRLFVAPVSVGAGGDVTVGEVSAMTADPNITKGRPSILQVQNGAVIFYSSVGTGNSRLYYTLFSGDPSTASYDGSRFTQPEIIDVGSGFESAVSPTVVGRRYHGNGDPVIELSFAGKLRGRANQEVFFGRILAGADGAPQDLSYLPIQSTETLQAEPEAGVYRALGVSWNPDYAPKLYQRGAGVDTDLEVAGTRSVDRSTGVITFKTKLGGTVYLDPNLGTVRFSSSVPNRSVVLVLSYQPTFLRVSTGTASGSTGADLAYDNRLTPNLNYWFKADGSAVDATDVIRTGRMMFTYGRAASGAGQASRPFMKTLRFGVELPAAVYTNEDGSIGSVTVTGNSSYFQVDPANKRIYFTAEDEDTPVTITYTPIDEATGQPGAAINLQAVVHLVTERGEAPLIMDKAVNESTLTTFLDPFDDISARRPGLVWLFWTSTRSGAPDIYFQTVAPLFTPTVAGG